MRQSFAKIVGHGLDLNVSLQSLLQVQEAREMFFKNYCNWISASIFAQDLCFLDITFNDVTRQTETDRQRAWTLVLAPGEVAVEQYKLALKRMFQTGHTISGHVVFQSGLPSFQKAELGTESTRRQPMRPQTGPQLVDFLTRPDWELVEDGFELWVERDVGRRRAELPVVRPARHRKPTLRHTFFRTYAEPGAAIDFDHLSTRRFDEMWGQYIRRLCELDAPRSHRDQPISIVIAAPIGIRPEVNRGRFLRFADLYFGLAAGEARTPEAMKAKAVDFLRLLTLQLYRANLNSYAHFLGVRDSGHAFGHEIKHIAVGLAHHWMPLAKDLFEVETVPREEIPFALPDAHAERSPRLFGKVYIAEEYEWLRQEMGVLPLRQLLLDSGKLIRVWCLLDNWVDFEALAKEKTRLQDFLTSCLREAQAMMMPHLLKNETAKDLANAKELKAAYDALKRVFALQQLSFGWRGGAAEIEIDPKDKRATWLARLFLASFKGCVQHGDPLLPITVTVSQDTVGGTITIDIQNPVRRHFELLIGLLEERGELRSIASNVVGLFLNASGGADTLGQQFSTQKVLELCLVECHGTLKEFAGRGSDPFRVQFSYPISSKGPSDANDRVG